MVRTREQLAKLMQVQKASSAACPRLGAIIPSNLHFSPLSDTTKLLRVKNARISPATLFAAFVPSVVTETKGETLDLTERLMRDQRPGTEMTKRPNEV
nr:hypothetical protein Iba_chr12cCG5860 [Ipomoea batatas]